MAGASGGAGAVHGAAGEGLGHGAGVSSTTDVQLRDVEDVFQLLSVIQGYSMSQLGQSETPGVFLRSAKSLTQRLTS